MRATSLAWLTAIVLVSAGAVRLVAPAVAVAGSDPSQPSVPTPKAERHPEIERAIAALERAKAHLQHAAHDFGGHRVEALAAVDKALEQLRLALQYDKK
jgi:hypothetical protein